MRPARAAAARSTRSAVWKRIAPRNGRRLPWREAAKKIGGTEVIEDEEFEVIVEDPEIPDDVWDEEKEKR